MPRPEFLYWARAQACMGQGQWPTAMQQLQSLQSLDPDGVHTHLLAAQIDRHAGRVGQAAERALAAAEQHANDPSVLVDLVSILQQVGETARAHEVFVHAGWEGVESTDVAYRYAILCQGFGQHEQALALFENLLARSPEQAILRFLCGQQLEFLGRFEEAVAVYADCLTHSPGLGYAAYKLARLRSPADGADLLRLIEHGLRHVQPRTSGRADFEFARYHVLENLGQNAAAWQALQSANTEMSTLNAIDLGAKEADVRRSCASMVAQSIPIADQMPAGPCPIFIIGMPRSGTTLLERMLSNHSQVAGAGELTDFGAQLLRVLGHGDLFGAHGISAMTAATCAELGRRYLVQTAWRAGGKSCFVDKQPANWMLVGLIHAALPQAKIVHIVRDPMDACFSIWRARFADAHEWSYRLDTLADRFESCQCLMRHWKRVCPQAIHELDHAELVNQPAATLREVMAFCGLEWEPGCEDPSRNPAPVATLSSSQARAPVNTQGLGRWHRYEEQLEPLHQRLSRM